MNSFTTIPKFRFWCQKILPLVYDDSLSYMELLCKVIDYLNKVIEDINNIPDYINSMVSDEKLKEILSELLDELREQIARANEGENTTASYDRDIDELIWLNGKLIRMTRAILAGDRYIVDDGTPDVTGNFVYTSVEVEMQRIKNSLTSEINARQQADEQLQTNINAEAEAREQADTQLQGNISAEASAREQADIQLQGNIDGEASARGQADTQLQTNINNLGLRITDEVQTLNEKIDDIPQVHIIDIINEGAIGDGTTDNSSVISNIFTNLQGGEIILIPHGDFRILSDINITKPCTILGGGSFMKGLWNGSHEGSVLRFSSGNGIRIKSAGVNIEGIGIIGNASNIAIEYQPDSEIGIGSICGSLRNINIWQVNFGVKFTNCFKTVMENVFVHTGTVGFELGESPTGFTSLTMINCWAASCTHGYRLYVGIYSSLIDCACDNCQYGYEIYGCGGMKLLNCGVEGATVVPVIMESCNDVVIDGLVAVDCGGDTYASSLVRIQSNNKRCTITNSQTINPKANMHAIVSISPSTDNFIYNNIINQINYQGTIVNDNHIVLQADS